MSAETAFMELLKIAAMDGLMVDTHCVTRRDYIGWYALRTGDNVSHPNQDVYL